VEAEAAAPTTLVDVILLGVLTLVAACGLTAWRGRQVLDQRFPATLADEAIDAAADRFPLVAEQATEFIAFRALRGARCPRIFRIVPQTYPLFRRSSSVVPARPTLKTASALFLTALSRRETCQLGARFGGSPRP
jgi:hypothetical protein